ncbi:hypothetical protein [Neobacillus niacini]|uniref:hypothetical protein n=1 Tax=Neobacillus niacini TaxID=86668 RepID=UPI00203B1CE6|nr:hypothetical protein [Neobacillus niacini]MCM3691132.1 hypothetical protein [Neobacillus niacini]
MTYEFDILVNNAIENSPDWLMDDIRNILNKKNGQIRLSFVISELYSRYTFSIKHITSAMNQSSEWSIVSHDRLNFIDNNIDLIQYIIKRIK